MIERIYDIIDWMILVGLTLLVTGLVSTLILKMWEQFLR